MLKRYFKNKNSQKKIVFIVEDNEVYARSLEAYLKRRFPAIDQIKIFNIGEMCLMELHLHPVVIIIDYILNTEFEPAHNGIEIIKRVKAERPQTNIIVLSADEKLEDNLKSIKEYDCDYVKKGPDAFNELELCIKAIFEQKKSDTLTPWS